MFSPETIALLTAVFLASMVEAVEAFTIVLAMGLTRNWRSTIIGTLAALLTLAVVTTGIGFTLSRLTATLLGSTEALLQFIVGVLLLVFGLQWLRKAILRATGLKAIHDEDAIFQREQNAARSAGAEQKFGLDWFAFVISYKGVFLEGMEVVFIVITFGLQAQKNQYAARHAVGRICRAGGRGLDCRRRRHGAQTALRGAGEHHEVRRRAAALHLRRLLERGRSGVFQRPAHEPGMAGRRLGVTRGIACLGHRLLAHGCDIKTAGTPELPHAIIHHDRGEIMKLLGTIIAGFFRFWYDFLIGDCWQIAAGVAVVMGGLAVALHAGLFTLVRHDNELTHPWLPLAAGAAMMLLIVLSVLIEFQAKNKKG